MTEDLEALRRNMGLSVGGFKNLTKDRGVGDSRRGGSGAQISSDRLLKNLFEQNPEMWAAMIQSSGGGLGSLGGPMFAEGLRAAAAKISNQASEAKAAARRPKKQLNTGRTGGSLGVFKPSEEQLSTRKKLSENRFNRQERAKDFRQELSEERARNSLRLESLMQILGGIEGRKGFDETIVEEQMFNSAGKTEKMPLTTTRSGNSDLFREIFSQFVRGL